MKTCDPFQYQLVFNCSQIGDQVEISIKIEMYQPTATEKKLIPGAKM
jgi:hypothetical protein